MWSFIHWKMSLTPFFSQKTFSSGILYTTSSIFHSALLVWFVWFRCNQLKFFICVINHKQSRLTNTWRAFSSPEPIIIQVSSSPEDLLINRLQHTMRTNHNYTQGSRLIWIWMNKRGTNTWTNVNTILKEIQKIQPRTDPP